MRFLCSKSEGFIYGQVFPSNHPNTWIIWKLRWGGDTTVEYEISEDFSHLLINISSYYRIHSNIIVLNTLV